MRRIAIISVPRCYCEIFAISRRAENEWDYWRLFLTAIPAGHKMEISLAIKNLGHIKDVEMQTGITN